MTKVALHQVKLLYDNTITFAEVALALNKLVLTDKTRIVTRGGHKITAYEPVTVITIMLAKFGYKVTINCDVDVHGHLVLSFTQTPYNKENGE
jgi:hypothetical protein